MEEQRYSESFYNFINQHINEDVTKLRLKYHMCNKYDFDVNFAITQIDCHKRVKHKLPQLFNNYEFIFPSKLLSEQCTDEIIAKFHAQLFKGCDYVADLTAGLCIDTFYISKVVDKVISCEIDKTTADIGAYNMSRLAQNVKVLCVDSAEYLASMPQVDAIFVDPARRNPNLNRVYNLNDCMPNVISLHDNIISKCKFYVVKASPMIDISDTIRTIKNVSDIWIVGIKNECKEILIKVVQSESNQPVIHTINYISENNVEKLSFSFYEQHTPAKLAETTVNGYLYEPNSCLMKAGAFGEIEYTFGIYPINVNSHIFVSDHIVEHFPGRKFVIIEIIPFKDKEYKNIKCRYPQINITTRNFYLSPDELKKKLKVKDGGEFYLFATTDKHNSAILIICKKIIS